MNLAYYPGCSLNQSAKLYNHQTNIVFQKLGLNLQEVEDWNCCGATSVSKINDFMAVALSARNLGIAESTGVSEMVIPCSACYSRTLVAQQRLMDDPALTEDINKELAKKVDNTIKVSSILEVLLRVVGADDFKPQYAGKLADLVPVCYYGCMSTRFPYQVSVPDDVENPQGMENIMKALGVNALDWNYKTRCCGASSSVYEPVVARKLMAKIMRDALAWGANCIVTGCPMCQMNLDAQQEQICEEFDIRERLPVYFITELLGIALGLSEKELLLHQHFIKGPSFPEIVEE